MILSCYAEGKPGEWEAFCLDFDLAVQGESFEEVYRELGEAISLYLEYVASLPVEERPAFLKRKMPFLTRLGFIWSMLRSLLFGATDGGKVKAEFVLPCPA